MTNSSPAQAPVRVLIIGSGFAGLGLAIQLQARGIDDFLILEKGAEIGGTWRDNSYPGSACDVPSHLYSFSFALKPDWTRKYAPQAEIHAYMLDCVTRYRLRPKIRLNTEVQSARFDEARALWQVSLSNGETLEAPVLVSACGQLNQPAYPKIPGIERFQGEAFHSARWRHDLDLAGKRVGVIGTGASAIQFVPQVQPKAAQLTLFQRSPAYVLAKPDRPYRPWERSVMRAAPWLQRIDRLLKYIQHEARALAFVHAPWLMPLFRREFVNHLNRHMPDAQKRAQLVPDYPMGCKRILISNDYYPALAQPNVQIVSSAIAEVNECGVVDREGHEYPCDVLIYGTGFAATDFLAPMQITGRGGLDLNEAWKEGAEAYKGISVSGFPNLFILYGPNTNLGHNSIIYMLESQFSYVLGCIEALQKQGLRYIDVKAEVQQRYNQMIHAGNRGSIWEHGCDSWYKIASGKNTNNWPGFTLTYRYQTRAPELTDYDCIR